MLACLSIACLPLCLARRDEVDAEKVHGLLRLQLLTELVVEAKPEEQQFKQWLQVCGPLPTCLSMMPAVSQHR